MSRDGSGGYQLPEPPFVFDTIIDETAMNNNLADLGNEMANSIAADGQTTPTANLKMGGRRHINVGDAVDRTDYPAVGQIQDGGFVYAGLATGTANAIVLTLSPNITALVEGMEVLFKAASTNTGATTIKIGGATAVAAEVDGAAMVGGEIVADKFHRATYDGTALQVTRLSMPEADTSPTTTQGDMIRRGASEDERLALGIAGLPLVAGATDPDYAALTASGLAAEIPRGTIDGLTLSNNGVDPTNDIDIAAGACWSDDRLAAIYLASGITKRLDATFAEGTNQGGLDTGTAAADEVYAVWAIRRSDTGVSDVLFSLSFTSPTLPASYDQKQLIGGFLTTTGAAIIPFVQSENYFEFTGDGNAVEDISDSTITDETYETGTLSVPPNSVARVAANYNNPTSTASNNGRLYLRRPGGTLLANQTADAFLLLEVASNSDRVGGVGDILTDENSQIQYAAKESSGTATITIKVYGFIMINRGRQWT